MLVALLIVTVLAAAVPLPVAAAVAVPRLVLDLLVLVGMVGTK
jgi:hypothetical protein